MHWARETTEDDTHPNRVARIELAERLHFEGDEGSTGGVSDLFSDFAGVREEFAKRLSDEVSDESTRYRGYLDSHIAQCHEYTCNHPGLGIAHFERGKMLYEKGDKGTAVEDFNEAIRLEAPHPGICYYYRGLTRANLGEDEGAAGDFEIALKYHEHVSPDIWLGIGDFHSRFGQFEKAEAAYGRCSSLLPGNLDYLERVAAARLEKEAEADYSTLLTQDPNSAEAYAGRGRARLGLGLGKEAEARVDLEESIRLDPANRESRRLLERVGVLDHFA